MSKLTLVIAFIMSSALATPVIASPSTQFFPAENGKPFSAAVRIGYLLNPVRDSGTRIAY